MPRRLRVYTAGFVNARLRRLLRLAGYSVTTGSPRGGDAVGVWGKSPYAKRGETVAQRTGTPLVRIEDAFLRSLHPGRAGEPPLGLLIDTLGIHFDASAPSDLETLLATHPLDDTALLDRARAAIARLRAAHLTKYSAVDPALPGPDPGYVLVIDQTVGDASVIASKGDRARFLEMLTYAREENAGQRIVIKAHPETSEGYRAGHYRDEDLAPRISFCDGPVSPWHLLEGATAVYTLSSQIGFEAILAGHRPHVFGTPFYAGWGLTEDREPIVRRQRVLTRAQLFAGAMILAPVWYDPYRDARGELEDVLGALEATARAWREDRHGWVAEGMRLWKRRPLQRFFGGSRPVRFVDRRAAEIATSTGRRRMAWASKAPEVEDLVRVEDGFLRSRGLGAALVPPLSLVCDAQGIYYDPKGASDLEDLIRASPRLRPDQLQRAARLRAALVDGGLSKYNLAGAVPPLPEGRLVLVPGQVEDDASILRGAGSIRTNRDLLLAARRAEPEAVLIYKPHPDVVAGLRDGGVQDAAQIADVVIEECDMAALLRMVDAVWTMTSLTGFEALLRGVPVTTTGMPFYAGWGLTTDQHEAPDRRRMPGVTLDGLVHATLIDYPRYLDPVTGLPCPVEVIAARLASRDVGRRGPALRLLSKAQGLFASQAGLWRR